jgi:hypothetical protein
MSRSKAIKKITTKLGYAHSAERSQDALEREILFQKKPQLLFLSPWSNISARWAFVLVNWIKTAPLPVDVTLERAAH